ncbi:EAL domain-containing protein [Litoribrevibacter euphylliae]|uniref:EAL domain-containing protein n=1 Tax=Litoribrevibacter euphylliae TaxID=1834034 RepID=A0ABV7HI04_9GAMM
MTYNQCEAYPVPLAPRKSVVSLPKILIVDDRKENQRAIEVILENLDAEFYSAFNGEEALSMSLRHNFAVVLMDVMMPVMDGFETANLMRINQRTKHTPIIFITAADRTDEFEYKGYQAGAVDYLFKPIKPSTLESKVKVFLDLEIQRQQLKETLEDIERLKRKNQLLLKSVGEGILGLDNEGLVTFSNPAAQKLLGCSEAELENQSVLDYLILGDSKSHSIEWKDAPIYRVCSEGKMYHETLGIFRKKVEGAFPTEYHATPIYDDNKLVGVVLAFQDITERKRAEEQLSQLAQYDSLTGLNNRYSFQNLLAQSISRAKRAGSSVALLFMDLDKFKIVNDTMGHEIGDYLLQDVAVRIRKCLRDGDVIGRIGGDEFTVVLESIHTARDIAAIAQKIIEFLGEPFYLRDHEIHIGISIGIATYPESAKDEEALMKCADIAMYKVKENGRNNFRFFTETMQQEVHYSLQLENRLRVALQLNQFLLYYQPKIDPYQQKVIGFEALLRWRVGSDEFISPSDFIPKAEEMGLIISIGRWVIEQSCRQFRAWLDAGIVDESMSMAINISIKQLQHQSLKSTIKECIETYQLPIGCLEIEVTESIMIDNVEHIIKLLAELQEMGIKISIDDFGTGYSSLNYLRRLPIDALKIDMSFVRALHEGEQSQAIVKAIVSLSEILGLTVIAEGVETEEQLEFLKGLECDFIQGYYYSKPLDETKAEAYLVDFKKQYSN